MSNGEYFGGYIYPGFSAMQKCYAGISDVLDVEFEDSLKNIQDITTTQEALTYGFLKPLHVEISSYDLPIYITGGDMLRLKKYLLMQHLMICLYLRA
jgi:type III pantothenate kinase